MTFKIMQSNTMFTKRKGNRSYIYSGFERITVFKTTKIEKCSLDCSHKAVMTVISI